MLMEADCFRYGGLIVVEIFVRLRLSGDNVVSMLMEANSFCDDKFLFYFSLVGFIVDLYGKICIVNYFYFV